MSTDIGTNFTGEYKLIDGKNQPVYENNDGKKFVTIDGKRVFLEEPILNYNKKWADFYTQRLEETQDLIAELETQKYSLTKFNQNANSLFSNYLESLDVNHINDITNKSQRNEAKNKEKLVTSSSWDIVFMKNKIFSACMSAFGYACDICKFS